LGTPETRFFHSSPLETHSRRGARPTTLDEPLSLQWSNATNDHSSATDLAGIDQSPANHTIEQRKDTLQMNKRRNRNNNEKTSTEKFQSLWNGRQRTRGNSTTTLHRRRLCVTSAASNFGTHLTASFLLPVTFGSKHTQSPAACTINPSCSTIFLP